MADNSNTLQLTLHVKDDGSVVIDTVKGKIEGLEQTTNKSGSGIGSMLSGLKGNWMAVAGVVTAGALAVNKAIETMQEYVNIAAEAEQIESRMAFQLGQVGYKFDEIKPFVDSFADSILKTTRFSDEMARQGLGQMMQYTADVGQAMQGVKLAMDMSTQSGQDLGSTTRLVGMAMNGNAEILGRWIPELRDLDSKLGANATSAEKAAYAIKILNEKFGGASQKDLNTYAGQIQNLKNQYDELKESAGRAIMKTGVPQTLMTGAKGILTGIEELQSGGPEELMKNWDAQIAAAKKANEQAKVAIAIKAHEDELADWKGKQEQRQAMQFQFATQEWTLKKNTMALIDAEEYVAIEKAKKYGADLNQIRQVYHLKRLDQIKKEKEEEQNAMLSLATMWKGYYDERIAKENEIIGLIKGEGIETTIGAKFEFAGVEEQFRKISEQAGMFTPEEFEKIKAAYAEKLKKILPFQGGEWEEFTVPTGREMGPSGPRTTWGTDKRWRESAMNEEQRRIEQMREESARRIETMGAGITGARPGDIINQFDESRNRVLELQREIDKIHEVKIAVESGRLIETINEVRNLGSELADITNRVWKISVDISGEEIASNIEQQLVSRFQNGRSPLRNLIEEGR